MNTVPDWTRHYQPGVPAEITLPTQSLVDMCEQAVSEAGDAVAVQFFGRTTTYKKLGEQINRAAEGLRLRGVQPGDRVALILPNCPQHVIAFYAVLRLGAVVVEHNPLYTAAELREQFRNHRARVVIGMDAQLPKVVGQPGVDLDHVIAVNLLDEFPRVTRLALSLPLPKLRETRKRLTQPASFATSWHDLLAAPQIDRAHPRPGVNDLAVIQYTSGTTGEPKGAMLTHLNLYANALQGEAWMHGATYREEVFYAVLPMFHAFGMTLYLTYGIRKQARLVLFPTFDAEMVVRTAKNTPPTVFCAVPPIYRKTAEVARKKRVDLSAAKYCISGAMALSDDIVEEWESLSGGLLVEGYGMTESSPVALGNPFWPTRRTGTIGIPFPSTLMKVVDPENPAVEVDQGQPGELLIKGPQVFGGYWENPEATAATLLEDGWLRTGDLVTVDEDGFATIVDRVKEIIITGGFNVSPSEVEEVLRRHPSVADAAVVGRRVDGGEQVVAALEVADGAGSVDTEELRAFCKRDLAAYKVPREFTLVDELPRSMLGKVLRKQVRDTHFTG